MSARNKKQYSHSWCIWHTAGAVSTPPVTRKESTPPATTNWRDDLTLAPIEWLVERYEKDIIFDCHTLSARISRSEAGTELIRRGRPALRAIGNRIRITIREGSLVQEQVSFAWDQFIAWVSLLYSIIETHKLPAAPYGNNVMYGNQTPRNWYQYCFRVG